MGRLNEMAQKPKKVQRFGGNACFIGRHRARVPKKRNFGAGITAAGGANQKTAKTAPREVRIARS